MISSFHLLPMSRTVVATGQAGISSFVSMESLLSDRIKMNITIRIIIWNIPEHYTARCFVLLGYSEGAYPQSKPRREGRSLIIE